VARIVGVGMTPLGKHNKKPSMLMRLRLNLILIFSKEEEISLIKLLSFCRCRQSLELALGDAGMTLRQLDGLVAIPSLADPHFVRTRARVVAWGAC
jgi:hypothetical protein